MRKLQTKANSIQSLWPPKPCLMSLHQRIIHLVGWHLNINFHLLSYARDHGKQISSLASASVAALSCCLGFPSDNELMCCCCCCWSCSAVIHSLSLWGWQLSRNLLGFSTWLALLRYPGLWTEWQPAVTSLQWERAIVGLLWMQRHPALKVEWIPHSLLSGVMAAAVTIKTF